MRGTIVDAVKYPPNLGGGQGYIVRTDEGKLELWAEEALELETSANVQPEDDEDLEEDEEE